MTSGALPDCLSSPSSPIENIPSCGTEPNEEMQISRFQRLMFESEDGAFHIDVRFEDKTVWLTQANIL